MRNKPFYITWIFLLLGFVTSAQKTLIEKGKHKYEAYAFQEAIRTVEHLKSSTSRNMYFEIADLSFNSNASEFAPAFKGTELIYASNKKNTWFKKSLDELDNEYFFDFYTIPLDKLKSGNDYGTLWDGFKTIAHESTATFSTDGKTVYFTRNNSKNGKLNRDGKGVSRLKVYRANFVNNNWSEAVELPFNSDAYSVAHPTLNKDEDKLYFSSDMPGTLGSSDIFYVEIKKDGTFGPPINMGQQVNTEARETFPFISSENVLYFASNGHPGLGGLDLFAMKLGTKEVLNLGEPVNSPWDDFSLIIDDITKEGYIASNREGGKGADDIYAITNIEPLPFKCETIILAKVIDNDTGAPIPNAQFENSSRNTGHIQIENNGSGEFQIVSLDCENTPLILRAISEGYKDVIVAMDTLKIFDNITISLEGVEQPVLDLGTDLFKNLKLSPIYFELNNAHLQSSAFHELDKVYAYLKDNPTIKMEVRSYTDSRGSDTYNMRLSQKRAESTVGYFISKGIDPSRIKGVGYGESQLLNNCSNGSECSNREHENNSRSEFIIVE